MDVYEQIVEKVSKYKSEESRKGVREAPGKECMKLKKLCTLTVIQTVTYADCKNIQNIPVFLPRVFGLEFEKRTCP